MPAPAYHVWTLAAELPPTKTYPKPGQRLIYLRAPGVLQWDAEKNHPVSFCLFDVDILQWRGSKEDQEGYHVSELDEQTIRNLPRDGYGRPARMGYLFEKFTAEPTPEEPGIYQVACGADGRAYWCGCLGSRGHYQTSDCKHKNLVSYLADMSARTDRPAQPENTASARPEAA